MRLAPLDPLALLPSSPELTSVGALFPLAVYTMMIAPTGPRSCNVSFDVYRHKTCTDEQFDEAHKFFVQVETEDKMLCANVQKNLERGNYNSGPLHRASLSPSLSLSCCARGGSRRAHRLTRPPLLPAAFRESGCIYFQRWYVEHLKEHFAKEQAAGAEITGGKSFYRGAPTDVDDFAAKVDACSGACGGGKEAEW